ncbi:hypothetical protein [Alistipes sp.]|uniref:hypothetical protein n=1 Tax=Alistipes sp. TaxID=1872444 RepID=UPI0025C66D4E|nr:hypothetical protein [Alistipes sp.]
MEKLLFHRLIFALFAVSGCSSGKDYNGNRDGGFRAIPALRNRDEGLNLTCGSCCDATSGILAPDYPTPTTDGDASAAIRVALELCPTCCRVTDMNKY